MDEMALLEKWSDLISNFQNYDPSTTTISPTIISSCLIFNEKLLSEFLSDISSSTLLQASLGQDPTNICTKLPQILSSLASLSSTPPETAGETTSVTESPTETQVPSEKSENLSLIIQYLHLIRYLCRRNILKSTSNYSNISLLTSGGICPILIQIYHKYGDVEAALVEAMCWCIMILASDNPQNQIDIANEGGCDLILKSLNTYAGNIEIIEMICRALRNLSSNLSIAAYCMTQGVGDLITGTIVIHSSNPIQLEAALWVVVNLACQVENATVLGSSGICVAITDALRVNLSNEGVIHAACWAIRNLSCGSGFNYVQFSHTDVCNSIVQILLSSSTISKSDLSFPSCLIPALWAVSNLTCDNEISEQYGRIDQSCTILVTVFRNYYLQLTSMWNIPEFEHLISDYLNVLEAVLWAIRNSSTGGVACHTQLVSEGLMEILTSFLESGWVGDQSPAHISIACGVIVNLLSVEYDTLVLAPLLSPSTPLPHVLQIGNIPLCELLTHILRKYPESLEIQESILRSFRLLIRIYQDSQQYISYFQEANICSLAALALKTHQDSSDLIRNSSELLLLLHYESHPQDLEFIELIAQQIDEKNLNEESARTPAPTDQPVKRGAVDPNSKRVILRPYEEMIQIWLPVTICERYGW